jgi:hypothetical protein
MREETNKRFPFRRLGAPVVVDQSEDAKGETSSFFLLKGRWKGPLAAKRYDFLGCLTTTREELHGILVPGAKVKVSVPPR